MSKLILCRGIPASGKTSFAKSWVAEDPEHRIRVCRDDLRKMLYNAGPAPLSWQQEQSISATERAIAKTALEKGKDVVVDAMNLRAKWVKQWFTLGYGVEFKDFEVNLEDALIRNAERGGTVPPEAIESIYRKFTRNGVLPEPPEPPSVAVAEKYEADWGLPKAIIVDVDGTLAHMTGRSPYDYSRVHEDAVDESVRHVVNELAGSGHHVIIVSGRKDDCEAETREWLDDNGVIYDEVHMRKSGDDRKDATVKAEIFNEHIRGKYNVVAVLDDRNQVVNMWREMGLKCLQVQPGDF